MDIIINIGTKKFKKVGSANNVVLKISKSWSEIEKLISNSLNIWDIQIKVKNNIMKFKRYLK